MDNSDYELHKHLNNNQKTDDILFYFDLVDLILRIYNRSYTICQLSGHQMKMSY